MRGLNGVHLYGPVEDIAHGTTPTGALMTQFHLRLSEAGAKILVLVYDSLSTMCRASLVEGQYVALDGSLRGTRGSLSVRAHEVVFHEERVETWRRPLNVVRLDGHFNQRRLEGMWAGEEYAETDIVVIGRTNDELKVPLYFAKELIGESRNIAPGGYASVIGSLISGPTGRLVVQAGYLVAHDEVRAVTGA